MHTHTHRGRSFSVQFPNAHSRQDWARLKPGAWTSVQVSHVDGGDPSTGAVVCLPGHALAESWVGSRGTGTGTKHSDVECWRPRW